MDNRSQPRLLIVDDEETMRVLLAKTLKRAGYRDVTTTASSDEARRWLTSERVDLVLTDMQMPGGSGLGLLECSGGVGRGVAAAKRGQQYQRYGILRGRSTEPPLASHSPLGIQR